MTSGFEQRELERVQTTLADGAHGMQSLANSAPDMPQAGASTGAIGAALSSLGQVMSTVTRATAGFADQVDAAARDYARTDQDNAGRVQHAKEGQG